MVEERGDRDMRFAVLCGGVVAIFLAHAAYLVCLTEDAFITYRFAANWVAGNGIVWNPGEAPVEGYTNFLWLIVCAALLVLGIDLPFATQAIGVLASLVSLVVVWRMAQRIGASPKQALLPCLVLACSGPFATWSTSGMETSAFALFVLLAVESTARTIERGGLARDAALTCAALIVASLLRPEGALVAAVLAAVALVTLLRRRAGGALPIVVTGLVYLTLMAGYTAWRIHYYGHPLPNTFYAKTGGGAAQAIRGVHYAGLFALHFVVPWTLTIALGVVGAVGADRVRWAKCFADPRIVLSLALLAAYTTYICFVGGDYMAMYRFFVPVLPAFGLVLAACIIAATESQGVTPQRLALIKAGILIGLVGSGFHSTPLEARWVAKPEQMHGNHRGVELERWYVERQRLIGRFFARYARPQESIATGAVGAVGWESRIAVFDVHGIVDPHIAHHGRAQQAIGTGLPGHEKTDYRYIFDKQPTFYMFSRKLRQKPLAGIPKLVPEIDAIVARDYKVGSVFLEDRANGQSGYFSFLERRDRVPPTRAKRGPPQPAR